jgi:hypothetical protein
MVTIEKLQNGYLVESYVKRPGAYAETIASALVLAEKYLLEIETKETTKQ